MQKKPELLCPAGSRAALEAAIEGGADAIYFGAADFNARMRAANFDDAALRDAVKLCRAYGVKSYITLNTRLYGRELLPALRLSASLYEYGADALIVADAGLAAELRRQIPDFELHASTQISGHSVSDAAALSAAGFARMVCPREITRGELYTLCERSPIEIEMFVHGAHCVSFSGQCLMSAVTGSRSGNRGSCAQPCRQEFTVNGRKGYPLSLKDMCLAGHIGEICESGVASLKIEGRQKSAEYVFGVTKIYRRLLDEGRDADENEIRELERLFSRQGFTDGYFRGSLHGMTGVRTADDATDAQAFGGLTKKVPVRAEIYAEAGQPIAYKLITPYRSAAVSGEAVRERGELAPMTAEGARRCAARLGATPYELTELECDINENAAVTQSMLNSLRRAAAKELDDCGRALPEVVYSEPAASAGTEKIIYTAEFASPDGISSSVAEFFDEIYLPPLPDGTDIPPELAGKLCISLPPIDFGEDESIYPKHGRVMVHTPGQLYEARRRSLVPVASMRFNVFNSAAAAVLNRAGAAAVTLSPELSMPQMRDIRAEGKTVTVYGRLPLMLLRRCVISDGGAKCAGRGGCQAALCDRRGYTFPVMASADCVNTVYNCVPLYMADRQDIAAATGAVRYHFIFTDETEDEVRDITERWKKGAPPMDVSKITRIKKG